MSLTRWMKRWARSEEHTSELQSPCNLVCRLLLEKKNGTANGRLHFHAVHFMRTLPTGSVDPNFGRRVRNRRQLNSLQNTWPYGYSMPIAVRYTQDAFSRSGWLWPVDAKGEPLKATSYMAVGFYVAKYVNKNFFLELAANRLGPHYSHTALQPK